MSWQEWLCLGVAAAFTLLLVPALLTYVVQLFRSDEPGRSRRGRSGRR